MSIAMGFDFEKLQTHKQNIMRLQAEIHGLLSRQNQYTSSIDEKPAIPAEHLRDIRMAVIMDDFTLNCFRPECCLSEISPSQFPAEIENFQPDMLFIESAWEGNHGLWKNKIAKGSEELFALIAHCHAHNIPVIFWNKEDPIHFDDFIIVAKAVDYVFTTDIDCVPAYRRILRHERIYHLHFAAQPAIHNPIEAIERKDCFCFAGAYYRCYPKRARIFDEFASLFLSTKGLEIYDREYGRKRTVYKFPSRYAPYILGKLEPEKIDKAYKGYYYGINMNTITDSSSMFARRVFELMASNTVTVGNFSQGLVNYFGKLTICTDNTAELVSSLDKYCGTQTKLRKYRLLGLREVLTRHLYEDRLEQIVNTVFRVSLQKRLPTITIIAKAETHDNCQKIIGEFENQAYGNKKLLLFYQDKVITDNQTELAICRQTRNDLISTAIEEGYIAFFDERDYYAPYYLYDLVYTLRYCDADVVGKASYYYREDSELQLCGQKTYGYVPALEIRRSILCLTLVSDMTFEELMQTSTIRRGTIFSVDEWNYCQDATREPFCDVSDLDAFQQAE